VAVALKAGADEHKLECHMSHQYFCIIPTLGNAFCAEHSSRLRCV